MNNLIIDIGNTSTKVGVFKQEEQIYFEKFQNIEFSKLSLIIKKYNCKNAIYSSVVNGNDELDIFLRKNIEKYISLDNHTPIPIKNLYKTPETLGKDRLAVCVGANQIKPNTNILVIDIGTAVTYDIINSKNQYVGGNISLGLEMRAKALNVFTSKLPKVEVLKETSLYGTTTETALQCGIINGLEYEICGYIDNISKNYPKLSVFLTGGGAFYFEKKLKNVIFAQNLLLIGLNRILMYR